ncbi:MAG: glycosyltransferase, partial [Clostridia bacterium]|nr:glycosyltransferase [Clostridia bacterium]
MVKVSVIMGIYNCSDTLDQAISSILSQSYTDFEIIMCDDCS